MFNKIESNDPYATIKTQIAELKKIFPRSNNEKMAQALWNLGVELPDPGGCAPSLSLRQGLIPEPVKQVLKKLIEECNLENDPVQEEENRTSFKPE